MTTGWVQTEVRPPTHEWVRRYLDFLGIGRRSPSLAALAELARAHVRAVTFENVSSILRRRAHPGAVVPPIDPDALLLQWERRSAGGLCYDVATMLGRLLAALGYDVATIPGTIAFPGSHQALRVALGGQRYLVEGAGGPFFEPIPLAGPFEIDHAGLGYRFRPDGEDWVQERWIDGAWAPFCRYLLREGTAAEREAAYQRHHTPGATWVLGTITLIRCNDDETLVLRDEELTHFSSAGKRRERLSTVADYVRAAETSFVLPGLAIAEAVEAWRAGRPA